MSVDRAEGSGLALAIAGHVALFALLSIGIAHREPPKHFEAPAIDVQLVDAVGLQSAAPTPATEAPQQQTAPEAGPPELAKAAAPPPPAPQPKPVPKQEALPEPRPVKAKVAPATPAPAPVPAKAAPAKSAPAAKPSLLSSNLLSDLKASARAEGKGSRTTGSRIGADFLKGVANPSTGKGVSARAPISGAAMNGLAAAIKRQVQPCYDLGSLGGTPATQIVTVLHLRFNKDGSVAGTPQISEQTGVTDDNRSYKQQMAEISRRAVLRCAPLKLPPELYEGGWDNIEMGFTPGQMR
jgi:outer membrane biosynthesis protein TonB